MNTRMPRSLYRRMEQLEARTAPAGEPLIINVQFISAVDKSVTGGFQARIPHSWGRRREAAWRFVATDIRGYRQFRPTRCFRVCLEVALKKYCPSGNPGDATIS